MCLDPRGMYGPHYKPGIHIYANDVAIRATRSSPGQMRYPVGSLFVKEKFDAERDTMPSVITVMEKRADTGRVEDWNFVMLRMSDRTVVRDGFKVSCVECHAHYSQTDFVSQQTDMLMLTFASK